MIGSHGLLASRAHDRAIGCGPRFLSLAVHRIVRFCASGAGASALMLSSRTLGSVVSTSTSTCGVSLGPGGLLAPEAFLATSVKPYSPSSLTSTVYGGWRP